MQNPIEYILTKMSDAQKKKLYFIKSPQHNLKAIENFLTKRNYEVIIESDLKTSLMQILEISPDFIFIAWDHPNQKVITLPKAINQSIMTHIVLYCQSSAKEVIRKLEYSGFPNKLYPPISGPAIERLILKLQKESTATEQSSTSKPKSGSSKSNNKEEVINVRSKTSSTNQEKENNFSLIEENDGPLNDQKDSNANSQIHVSSKGQTSSFGKDFKISHDKQSEEDPLLSSNFMDELDGTGTDYNLEQSKSQLQIQKGVRGDLLKTKNNQLSAFKKKTLEASKKEQLKKGFEEEVKLNLQDILTTYLDNEMNQSSTQMNQSSTQMNQSSTQMNQSSTQMNQSSTQMNQSSTQMNQSSTQMNQLDESAKRSSAYCLSVSSSTWCGYLITYCDISIDYQSLEAVFTNWIKENFEELLDLDEMDHFEITVEKKNFKIWAQNNSEYFENIVYNETELLVCFLSIDPKLFIITFDEDEKFIEVPIDYVPTDASLNLSLYLHLPVNKKYLLYTPEFQQLNSDQKKRLIEKKVDKLFTPAEFEKAYKMTVAEQQLNILLSEIKSEAQA